MTKEPSRNEAELCGIPRSAPVFSHENHQKRFFRFLLEIPRLSGTPDLLPVLVPEALTAPVQPGVSLYIRGQLRSFNNKSGVGSRLVLTVYALAAEPGDGIPRNRILLQGALCKPPVLRRTPLGRSICDLMLAVSRRYGRADYLPAIAWGQLAQQVSLRSVGDTLALEGRFQSRIYHKVTPQGVEERTAYEVSIMRWAEPFAETGPDLSLQAAPH